MRKGKKEKMPRQEEEKDRQSERERRVRGGDSTGAKMQVLQARLQWFRQVAQGLTIKKIER
jgi:hypothetical protein